MKQFVAIVISGLALALFGGLAGSETEAAAKSQGANACARGYSPCLPVRQDLDCGQIPDTKKPVRVTGADPYGLDADHDGLGCELAGEGGGRQSPWGLILRKGKKEATSAKVGDTLTAVGWSPASMKGTRYQLCAAGGSCDDSSRYVLRGTVQAFGRWKVARGEGRGGVFRLSLRVNARVRAFDAVPLR